MYNWPYKLVHGESMNAKPKKSVKMLMPKTADVKYTGLEPEWAVQPTADNRRSAMLSTFNWYNYHYGKKEAKEFIISWLEHHDRSKDARAFKAVPEQSISLPVAWLCRMNEVGFVFDADDQANVDNSISTLIGANKAVKKVVEEAESAVPRVTIQDRLREKALECAGEMEGLFDEFMTAGYKMSADYKPIVVIRSMNISPQHVGVVAESFKARLSEIEEAIAGKDEQLTEGYSHLSKLQLKNIVKFCETVISDCGNYVQIKKVERKPRKKKPVSPEKLTQKFKYLKEFAELKLVSEPATKLVGASEAWLYDTKKRKLVYIVADSHVGNFTVKGTGLIGYDTSNSVQKTLRKPAEQLKSIMSGGVPAARKFFKDIKATETKFNGRGNENMVLLRIR